MKKKGISLLILAITIVVMTILVGTTITGISLATNDARLRVLIEELNSIETRVIEDYNLVGKLPIIGEAMNKDEVLAKVKAEDRNALLEEMELNKDEDSNFYQVSLFVLDVQSTKRGIKKTPDDIYIVSEDSLNIYYVKGVKIGQKRYFSVTQELVNISDVEPVEELDVTLSEKIKLSKKQKSWTNRIDLYVYTQMEERENIYIYLEGTSEYFNITDAIKEKGFVELSKASLQNKLDGVEYVRVEKRASLSLTSELIDSKRISIANLDMAPPTINQDTFKITNTVTERSVFCNATDSKSGVANFKYQIVSRKEGNNLVKDNETNVSDAFNATGTTRNEITEYLKSFGKISDGKKVKLPQSTYQVRLIVSDRAGNYSDYAEYILDTIKPVNEPELVTGMVPVKWNAGTSNFVETTKDDPEWYNYSSTSKKWANVVTKNSNGQITGYYVWIPRFAYKSLATPSTRDGSFDIVFLLGTTDKRFNTSTNQIENAPYDYITHPAFKDGTSSGFKNGEWDEEIEGFWFPKYESGFPTKGNNIPVTRSNVNLSTEGTNLITAAEFAKYSPVDSYNSVEKLAGNYTGPVKYTTDLRNAIDGRKSNSWPNTTPKITYPVFLPNTSAYNYLSSTDMYDLCRGLNDDGNPYGLSKSDSDTHLMKNSEWGAVTYLSTSDYGVKGTGIANNLANSMSKVGYKSLYGITAGGNVTSGQTGNVASYASISGNALAYQNRNQSTTGNVYGVYDMQGGSFERVSAYINNGSENLTTYLKNIAYDENGKERLQSTKYITKYLASQDDTGADDNYDTVDKLLELIDHTSNSALENLKINRWIYGDALRETSDNIIDYANEKDISSWYGDAIRYPSEAYPTMNRGGRGYDVTKTAVSQDENGVFSLTRSKGEGSYMDTFRPVIIPKK